MDEQGRLIDEPGRPEDARPPARPAETRVVVGTSGYSFDDWIGNFYPAHIRKGDMLQEYSKHFSAVEVNSTYYRVPGAPMMARMAAKTPDWFEFIVKANQEMTHKSSRDAALYQSFNEALAPLVETGKLRGVIAQFPWGFKPSPEAREHLAFLRERFDEVRGLPQDGLEKGRCPLFAEVRNAEWIEEGLFEGLRAQGIGYCSVDEPHIRGLVPPVARVTTDLGYVRLHGRNAKNWWGGRDGSGRASGDRYDYLYSEEELKEWVAKIKAMTRAARKTYVFFNNCHAGQAARNAALMKELLSLAL
jgi:uncharacterized protein YecE (DUF72 family)